MAPDVRPGQELIKEDSAEQVDGKRNGEIAIYVCPECGGSMWQVNAGKVVRFSCHVGHVYSADGLLEGYSEDLERSLWHASRALRDRASLMRQLANVARDRNAMKTAARYDEEAEMDARHADTIEQIVSASGMVSVEG